ncbi:tape measure protein [Prescottella equi]|uniref:Tape measure domain protein n=1 Tax=Prescottella equi ATCC 33707 TaxID=525370 RepID=E9T067_RHOHA|nr:tape measure protein [Prescottella equi]EGD24650.1 tape measure domain protein [Prescottella equi ATCC 33707]
MNDDVVWVPVLPSLRDFDRELGTKGAEAGKRAGEMTAKAMADAVAKGQASVEKAVAGVEKARNREADAAGKVRIAQAELNKMLQAGEQDTVKLTRAQEKLDAAERKLSEAKTSTSTATKNLATAKKDLESKTKAAARAAEEQGRAVRVAATDMDKGDRSAKSLTGSLASMAKGAGLAAAGFVGFKSIGSILTAGLNRLTTIEDATASMNIILGDTAKATALMEGIKKTVSGTPFNLDQFATAGKNLAAFGIEAEKIPTILRAVGEAAAASGKGAEGVGSVVDALGKMAAQGKVSLDQVWSISDAGVPALQILANGFGVTTDEMQKMISKGAAPAAQAIDILTKGILEGSDGAAGATKSYAGTMESLRGTFNGALGGLKASFARFGAAVLEPFMGLTKNAMTGVASGLDFVTKRIGGAASSVGNGVSQALSPAIDTVKLFIGTLTGNGADVNVPWMNTVIDAGTRVRGVIDDLRAGVAGLWEFITTGNINEGMAKLFDFNMPLLGRLEDLRWLVVDVVNEVTGGVRAMVSAFVDGGTDVTSSGLAGFLERVGLVARGLWDGFQWGLGILREVADFLRGLLSPALKWLQGVVVDLAVSALEGLWAAFQWGLDVIGSVVDVVMSVVDWFTRHKDVAIAIAGVIGAMLLPALASMVFELGLTAVAWGIVAAETAASTVATTAHTVASKASAAASKAWAAGVWLVNAALSANPIVLVIGAIAALVAGIVLAYRHSETFRNIVQKAWEGIKTAAGVAWGFLKGVFAWFGDAFTWIGEKATWLWQNVISPVFGFIGTAARVLMAIIGTVLIAPFLIAWNILSAAIQFAWNTFIKPVFDMWAAVATWLWTSVLQPVWGAIKVALQALGAFFGWVWSSLIKPAWDGLGAGISWVWQNVISPAWNALKAALQGVGAFFGWVWNTLVKPAWDGLGAGISWVWENVIRPAWDGLKAALQAVGDFFGWVWNTLIKPVWDALGAGLNWVWENVIKRAFDGITGGLGIVQDAFSKAVGFIEKVWDGVRAAVAKPIKFVIDSVYNNGIRAAWNKVAGFVGLGELEEYKPDWLGAYASGTSVLPGYSPGRDNMRFVSTDGRAAIDLSGGEGIIRPEVTATLGTHWVDGVNAAAARGGRSGVARYLGGYANGGVVDSLVSLVREHFPMMTITDTYRPGAADHHGSGLAIDFSNGYDSTPEMRGAAQWFHDNYGPQLLELIHSPFDGNIKNGQDVGDGFGYYGADIMAQHRNHVHVAAADPLGDPDGSGGSLLSRAWGAITRGLRWTVEKLFDAVMDPIGNAIPDFGGSMIGQFPRKAFDTLKDKAKEFLLGKADEKSSGSYGGGAEQWRSMMIEAYRNQGYDPTPAKIDAWIRQIASESGGDPNIAQQIVDVNGTGEAAGVGLGQMIPSTWAAYRDPSLPDDRRDPWAMTNAMVRYGEQKYGDSLLDVIGKGHGYDRGGIANGIGLMPKKILEPERVLDPAQTAAWEALVPHLIDVEAAMEMFDGLVSDLDAALAKVPGSAFEEHSRDTLDFFGLGKWGDLLFADQPQAAPVTAEPVADGLTDPDTADTVNESDRTDGPPPVVEAGPRGPLVNIEEALAFDLDELVEKLTRELRHVVLSDGMNGGWD